MKKILVLISITLLIIVCSSGLVSATLWTGEIKNMYESFTLNLGDEKNNIFQICPSDDQNSSWFYGSNYQVFTGLTNPISIKDVSKDVSTFSYINATISQENDIILFHDTNDFTQSPIPISSTIWLLGLGVISIIRIRKIRQKK